jgi:hypothetical protein
MPKIVQLEGGPYHRKRIAMPGPDYTMLPFVYKRGERQPGFASYVPSGCFTEDEIEIWALGGWLDDRMEFFPREDKSERR